MIRSWRETWRQGDFPFYWVQLADYKAEQSTPRDSAWAELREAQTLTLDREPNTGQAVIIDLGEAADIHPRHKREVGHRLARLALANDYGVDVSSVSPRYDTHEVNGDRVVIKLTREDALRTIDSSEVQGFTLAGENGRFVAATARLVGPHSIEVHSDRVAEPVAVRYAWADNPVCNLYTTSGLPVTPFRTDDWPGKTAKAR